MTNSTNILEDIEERSSKPKISIWRKLWVNRIGVLGLALMLFFTTSAIAGPYLPLEDPIRVDFSNTYAKPVWMDFENGTGILGKDNLGRDIFSRVIIGSRISLLVGFSAVAIGMASGICLGLVAGYKGGLTDDIIMRIADTQTAIPFLVLLIAVIAFLGGGLINIIVFIGMGSWIGFARLIRGEELSIRERDYVQAARALGAGDIRIMFRHILPNAFQPVIVAASLSFGGVIITEASLSFLGFGVSSAVPTWGKMVSDSRDYVTVAWHLSVFPAVAIMLVVLGANLTGDWLRDVLDPRLKGRQG